MRKIKKYFCILFLVTVVALILPNNTYSQEAKFKQTESGLVCMEAENYSDLILQGGTSYWEPITEPEGYSGTGGMQALPAGFEEHKVQSDAQIDAAILQYSVNFIKTLPVYVWLRSCHKDGYDDSVWYGLDDLIEGTAPLSYLNDEQTQTDWYWINHLMNDNWDRPLLVIPSEGVHNFQIYMREPSFKIDKIVLTTDENYRPDTEDSKGPAETLTVTDIQTYEPVIPMKYDLFQNYPNPFNPSTTISFELPRNSYVSIKIYNSLGEEVTELAGKEYFAGNHSVIFEASKLTSGVYFYVINTGEFISTRKMILQK